MPGRWGQGGRPSLDIERGKVGGPGSVKRPGRGIGIGDRCREQGGRKPM